MKVFSALICSVLALAGAGVAAPSPRSELRPVKLFGRDHVRVRDWAAAHKLQSRWLETDRRVLLTNVTQRLVLTANSQQAELNGIKIWLSYPVVASGGGLYLSSIDLQATVEPLLFPRKNPAGAKVKTVVLDPGHGGKDPGNRVGVEAEKKYTLLLAQEIRDQLKKSGIKVVFTRTSDTFVDLPERPAKAQKSGGDLFVSLHFNATAEGRNEVQGSEVYCLTPAGATSTNARGEGRTAWVTGNRSNDKSTLLAYKIQKALQAGLVSEDRGVRRARFAVLRDATMPAALIEAGFMSHPAEGGKIFTAAYRREMARAIVNGILAYKREVERV